MSPDVGAGRAPGTAPAVAVPPHARVLPEDPAVAYTFSGRERNLSLRVGGGDVAADRADVVGALGVGLDDAVFAEQVHGGAVARVGTTDRGRGAHRPEDAVAGVDALVTSDVGVALAVLVADCVPVVLVDPGHAVAVAHAGRRGVAADVVGATLRDLAGDDPSRVVAVVGPAIGGCCYEVDADLAAAFTAEVPAAAATTTWGTPALDLPAAVAARLVDAGVARVERVGGCTRCEPERWHSHRADPGSGRQAGVVVRRDERSARDAADGPARPAARHDLHGSRPGRP